MLKDNKYLIPVILAWTALLAHSSLAWSYSSGITGYSGSSGSTCSACHSGGTAPVLTLTGPNSVEAGSTNTYTLTMSGGQQNAGGFNVSTTAGTLSTTMSDATNDGGELRHTQPFSDNGSGIVWTFDLKAPVITGPVTLYASALSANGNFQPTGDNSSSTILSINVTPTQQLLPPSANFTSDAQIAPPGQDIQFDASSSTDGDGTISRYLWDFGDGVRFIEGVKPTHSFTKEGEYIVTLAATDNDGLTDATAITITITADTASAQGQALYNQNCIGCHGAGGGGGLAVAITGASAAQITSALNSIGEMQSINLTTDEIQLIAVYLASGAGGEPPPRPTDGPGLYGMFCAACHGDDGRGGSQIGVTGAPLPMIADAITNIPAMQGIDMTNDELQQVANFLTDGGSGDIPSDGQGLYEVFCSVCHGDDWQGRKFFGVTGASQPMITEAIGNVQWMQPLNHLDATQRQLIGQYLGTGGPAPLPTDAQGLYGVFCSVCHGAGGHGDKFKAVTGASSEFITSAITDQPWMNSLQLTTTQLQQIAGYLSGGGEPPLPADGEGLYGVFCAVCHGAGGHGGKFKAITGASDPMIAEAINGIPWMDELLLSATQRQAIAGFLGSGGTPPLPANGSGLYSVFCAVCHGDGGHGGKFIAVTGAPTSMINSATSNEPWMNGIDASSSQINLIAQFLTAGGGGTLPQDGQGLFGVFCSVCHGVDGRGGIYKVVTGTNQSFINRALNNVGLMNPLQTNTTQVTAIASFLAAGGSGAKPTTGSGLYHVYCETCHGPNGNGGPEENIRGQSAGSIGSALNGESAMQHLQPYLTSSDISAIASFLGGG